MDLGSGKAAGKVADQRAAADKLDRKLIVERAEADRKRAELLEKVQFLTLVFIRV